ncbi:MAG: hypothetical protein ABIX01_21500 [Chitinophagaceae bacterium]
MLMGSRVHSLSGVCNDSGNHSSTLNTKKCEPVAFAKTNPGRATSFIENDSSDEDKYLMCDDVEDEDGSDLSVKKDRSLMDAGLLPIFQSFLHARPSRYGALQLVWHRVSSLYILQRNLRI